MTSWATNGNSSIVSRFLSMASLDQVVSSFYRVSMTLTLMWLSCCLLVLPSFFIVFFKATRIMQRISRQIGNTFAVGFRFHGLDVTEFYRVLCADERCADWNEKKKKLVPQRQTFRCSKRLSMTDDDDDGDDGDHHHFLSVFFLYYYFFFGCR